MHVSNNMMARECTAFSLLYGSVEDRLLREIVSVSLNVFFLFCITLKDLANVPILPSEMFACAVKSLSH